MKWKNNEGGSDSADPEKKDPYYDDDGYSSFKAKGSKKAAILSGNPVNYLYWGLGIAGAAGVVLLLMLLFSSINEPAGQARVNELEQKIERLQQRLKKYDGMDEKVTHIWEQAKAFETFKTRFDRSEASMSLRMDHLAMSLDTLQKKTDEALQKVGKLEKAPVSPKVPPSRPSVKKAAVVKKAAALKTHTVVAGDTLFSISQRYDLSVKELKSLNQLTEGTVIHVGQKLTVSSPGG